MSLRCGTDLVDVRRLDRALARYGSALAGRIFTPGEIAYAEAARERSRLLLRYGNRFAAKEALIKLLDARGFGVTLQEMEVISGDSGAPQLRCTGQALALLRQRSGRDDGQAAQAALSLSLSDEWPYSLAFCVLSVGPVY